MSRGKASYAIKQAFLFIFSILVFAALGMAVLAYALDRPPKIPSQSPLFQVRPGESASAVASRLEEEGRIRSAAWFSAYARFSGAAQRIKAGAYELGEGMSSSAIVTAMAEGRLATIKVTVPEGYTLGQTARLLESRRVCARSDFLAAAKDPVLLSRLGIAAASAEGYLFPDTYEFSPYAKAEEAVIKMVEAFRTALEREIPQSLGMEAGLLHDKIILASIVEREYRVAEEAPLIASVFANRVRIGMALQSCATVVYVLTERLGQAHPEILSKQDIAVKDPYNSYLQRGLPPGPISNPGLVALKAVFAPPKTDYLYFRLIDSEEGTHHFSRSLDEHIQASALRAKAVGGGR